MSIDRYVDDKKSKIKNNNNTTDIMLLNKL